MSILGTLPIKPTKGTEHLTLNAPAEAEAWVRAKHAAQAADAQLDIAAAGLETPARALFFAANAGRAKPVGSIEAAGTSGRVLISYANAYAAKGGVTLLPADLIRERFTLRINGDAIPADKAPGFVNDLLALAARHGVPDAITATGGLAPVPTFGELRHVRLTPAQNLAAEAAGLGTRVSFRLR